MTGARITSDHAPGESYFLRLGPVATFNYGLLREMPQVLLEFVVLFWRGNAARMRLQSTPEGESAERAQASTTQAH